MIRARIAPVVVLVALLALTIVATLITADRSQERERERVDTQAETAAEGIDRRLAAYIEVLWGTAALFEASEDVTPVEFERAVGGSKVQRRYPGVQVIGFARRVAGGRLEAYEREETVLGGEAGYPPLRVFPRRTRDEHVVISRVHPLEGNETALGLDFLSEPGRRRAVRQAALLDSPAATPPVRLVQETGDQQGFLIMVPVRREGSELAGVAYAGFRVGDLLEGVRGDAGVDFDADVELVDAGTRFFDADPAKEVGDAPEDRRRVLPLRVAGRLWEVRIAAQGDVLSATERAAPWFVLGFGAVLSLLAAALLRSLTTARARADRMVDQRTAELQRSNEELERFAYLASHDLQEPLRTITAYVGLLERRLDGQLDERTRTWMGFVTEGAERMSALITGLLAYSRAGRRKEADRRASLDEAWDAAVANLGEAIRAEGATVTRGDLPAVASDPAEMTSLLQNLLLNALKYRSEAPPEVHADAVRTPDGWEIRVRDNGIGIDPRFHDRIFGLFQRLHTSDEYPGTGMGLAIVRKLAEASGGTVRVESAPGEGSTFVVVLPEAR